MEKTEQLHTRNERLSNIRKSAHARELQPQVISNISAESIEGEADADTSTLLTRSDCFMPKNMQVTDRTPLLMLESFSGMDIYKEIKDFYLRCGKPSKMYIDFTGGTKAMSAAAALAGAKEKFSVLHEKLPDPALRQQLGFVALLSKAYEAWDALDFIPAYESMLQLQREIERDKKLHRDYLLMDFSKHIDRQRAMMEHLQKIPQLQEARDMCGILENEDILHALAFTLYQNARTRDQQEKYDMATLLLYRLLEMMSQRRLIQYGIFASRPDYKNTKYNIRKFPALKEKSDTEKSEWLTGRFRNISEAVFRKEKDWSLPAPIASLDGFIILAALGDPILGNGKLAESVSTIKRIRSMVYLRNNSIFAHGLGPVSYKDYSKFKSFVFDMFLTFCKIENIDYHEWAKYTEWINPMQSKNYARAIR